MEGRVVRMKGSTLLSMGEDGWRLGQTRLLDVEEWKAPDAGAERGAAAGEQPATRRRSGSTRKEEGSGPSLH